MTTYSLRALFSALALWLALFATACGGKPPVDELDAARRAFDEAGESERCAEAEFRAARNLLDQAEAAFEDGDYDRSRQLAEAARAQSERAREAAANNEDCDDDESIDEVVESAVETRPPDRDPVELDDYDFVPIFFEFNASQLSPTSRATLDAHAAYLNDHPELHMTINGHADERGSTEYNLALGERRARTVRSYLEQMGVERARMSIVSYGEEMPISANFDDNRRAEFVVR